MAIGGVRELCFHGEDSVAKQDWGTKRQCPECGTRFYDLNRTPIVCVKCDTAFRPEPLLKPRRQREPDPKPVAAKPKPAEKPDEAAGNDKAEGKEPKKEAKS